MYYSAKIKEMMRLSKESEKLVILSSENETISVKYFEQFDDYTFQYSWNILKEISNTQQEVQESVNEFLTQKCIDDQIAQKLDIVHIGLISAYGTDYEIFCELIEHTKNDLLEQTRDTKYLFSGRKVLRVTQFYGKFSNPFDCMDVIQNWNEPEVKKILKSEELKNVAKGIFYRYLDEGKIVFSIGSKQKNTVFTEMNNTKIPQILCFDSIQGVSEISF